LLAFWRDVVDDGGKEVAGFENLEVPLGAPVGLGAVDDGLGGRVPGGGWREKGTRNKFSVTICHKGEARGRRG
jgi:hypothetical protein